MNLESYFFDEVNAYCERYNIKIKDSSKKYVIDLLANNNSLVTETKYVFDIYQDAMTECSESKYKKLGDYCTIKLGYFQRSVPNDLKQYYFTMGYSGFDMAYKRSKNDVYHDVYLDYKEILLLLNFLSGEKLLKSYNLEYELDIYHVLKYGILQKAIIVL